MYQFIFKKDHIKEQLKIQKDPKLALKETKVKYPNQVFINIKSNKDCVLDIVAQLNLQPEPADEQQKRMQELKKARENIDYEQMEVLENELKRYFDQNEEFFK